MKKLLSIVLVCTCLFGFAQKENGNNCFKRIYIGAGSTVGLGANAYMNISRHKPQMTYSAGLVFGVRLHKNVAIETGLKYTQHNAQTLSNQPYYYERGFCQTEFAPYSVRGKFSYIDIPLQVFINIGKKKLQGVIVAGTDFNFSLKKNIYHSLQTADSSPEIEMTDLQSAKEFNISPTLGVGISYQISPVINLRVMPIAHVQALDNSKLAHASERLWGTGIHVALTFGFVSTCQVGRQKAATQPTL